LDRHWLLDEINRNALHGIVPLMFMRAWRMRPEIDLRKSISA
jgi:hypothetical protein